MVDTETTGLSTESCCLIEVSALRVRQGRVAAEFSTLIRPPWREVQKNGQWQEGYVDDFIQGLTGITDEMLEGAPLPEETLPQVEDFLGRDLLLGHNVHNVGFDTAFLYDSFQKYLGRPLGNNSLDQLRLARKLLPQLPHHRLGDVAAALGVPYQGAHRALADCWITYGCYEKLRALALSQGTEEEFLPKTGRPCCGPGARWGKRWRPGWISWPSPPRGRSPSPARRAARTFCPRVPFTGCWAKAKRLDLAASPHYNGHKH